MNKQSQADSNPFDNIPERFKFILIRVFFGIVLFWAIFVLLANPGNSLGDRAAAVEALFTGLAFFGAIVALLFQTQQLRYQRRDLKLNLKELKLTRREVKKSNELSEKSVASLKLQLRATLLGHKLQAYAASLAFHDNEFRRFEHYDDPQHAAPHIVKRWDFKFKIEALEAELDFISRYAVASRNYRRACVINLCVDAAMRVANGATAIAADYFYNAQFLVLFASCQSECLLLDEFYRDSVPEIILATVEIREFIESLDISHMDRKVDVAVQLEYADKIRDMFMHIRKNADNWIS